MLSQCSLTKNQTPELVEFAFEENIMKFVSSVYIFSKMPSHCMKMPTFSPL